MQERLTFEYFTSVVLNGHYSDTRRYRPLVNTMVGLLKPEDVRVFYPKNLFLDEKNLQCFVFTENKVLVFVEGESSIKVDVIKFNQFNKIELNQEKDDYPEVVVRLSSISEDEIVLDARNDTNSTWRDRLQTNAIEAFKIIVKAP